MKYFQKIIFKREYLLFFFLLFSLDTHSCKLTRKFWNPREGAKALYGKSKQLTKLVKCFGRELIQDLADESWFWSEDTAGHGGAQPGKSPCSWKIYKYLGNDNYEIFACADEYGDIIPDKHESGSNKKVKCK